MLPKHFRANFLDRLSVKTMRYVKAVGSGKADGLVKRIYDMVAEDFFVNGSITSHSQVPDLMAGMWMGGRELALVSDRLDRTTKEAMSATLSRVNECAYCEDMLVALVHGSGKHQVASRIFTRAEGQVPDPVMRARLAWIEAVGTPGNNPTPYTPFAPEELPEAIGTLFAFSYINRFSHVVMDGSPAYELLGMRGTKGVGLRLFGFELKTTTERPLDPGRALPLLPPAPLPADFAWAAPNPRIADAVGRWAAVIERESAREISPAVSEVVGRSLERWDGEPMPISRSWVDAEVAELAGQDRAIARFALVVAKSLHQFDDELAQDVLGVERDEFRFIRVLAWSAFSAARRIAQREAERVRFAPPEEPVPIAEPVT